MGFTKTSKVDRSVVASVSHLNNKSGHWWNDRGLRTLNFLIFIPLMSEYVQGYDASLINNVQQLPVWQKGISPIFLSQPQLDSTRA
jgi:hypothetical protein